MVSDHDRTQLVLALEDRLGPGPARTLMALLPPFDWADVARQSDLVALRSDIADVRIELAAVRTEVAAVRTELKGEIAEVKGEIAEVKGEIAGIRADMKLQFAKFIAANVPMMFGTAGLVLAAAKLA